MAEEHTTEEFEIDMTLTMRYSETNEPEIEQLNLGVAPMVLIVPERDQHGNLTLSVDCTDFLEESDLADFLVAVANVVRQGGDNN